MKLSDRAWRNIWRWVDIELDERDVYDADSERAITREVVDFMLEDLESNGTWST